MKKHLLGGVAKGAFDEATAEARFNAWKENKQAGLDALRAKDAEAKKAAEKARLEAEKKVNETIAQKVAEKKAAEAAAKAEAEAEEFLAGLTADDNSQVMYESKATVREEFEGFRQMFLLLGSVLCGIIGLVGVLNFFNGIMTGILSRKREFAMLQSIGMTGKQLKSMLVYEGLLYALATVLISAVLIAIVGPLVGS